VTPSKVVAFTLNAATNTFQATPFSVTPIPTHTGRVQVAALDTNGDKLSEVATAILSNGVVTIQVFNNAGTQQSAFNAPVTGVEAVAISSIADPRTAGRDLISLAVSGTTNSILFLDPATGAQVGSLGGQPFVISSGPGLRPALWLSTI